MAHEHDPGGFVPDGNGQEDDSARSFALAHRTPGEKSGFENLANDFPNLFRREIRTLPAASYNVMELHLAIDAALGKPCRIGAVELDYQLCNVAPHFPMSGQTRQVLRGLHEGMQEFFVALEAFHKIFSTGYSASEMQ
jgi:hypothetical protein